MPGAHRRYRQDKLEQIVYKVVHEIKNRGLF